MMSGLMRLWFSVVFLSLLGAGAPAAYATNIAVPDVLSVAPATLEQGTKATLTMKLANFTANTKLELCAGVMPVGTFRGGDLGTLLDVEVATTAQPGRCLFWVNPNDGRPKKIAAALLTVVAAKSTYTPPPPPPPPAPQPSEPPKATIDVKKKVPGTIAVKKPLAPFAGVTITSVRPNDWISGRTVSGIMLEGAGFVPGMKVHFGRLDQKDISAAAPPGVDPTWIPVTLFGTGARGGRVERVTIAPGAEIGPRDVFVTIPGQE